jgi:hypothetical protein
MSKKTTLTQRPDESTERIYIITHCHSYHRRWAAIVVIVIVGWLDMRWLITIVNFMMRPYPVITINPWMQSTTKYLLLRLKIYT